MTVIRACAVAIGMMAPTLAFGEPGPVRGACMNDVKTLCGSVQPGGGRIRECMREHRAQLSNACKVAIADRMLERKQNRSERRGQKGPGERADN